MGSGVVAIEHKNYWQEKLKEIIWKKSCHLVEAKKEWKKRSCVQQLLKGVHIEQAKVTNRLERNADGLVTMVY